jgi:hypothetical protein
MTPTPTHEERAREIAVRLVCGQAVGASDGNTYIPRSPTVQELVAALLAFAEQSRATDRIVVVEECARVAEAECTLDKPYSEMIVAAQIAAAIRALSKEHNHVEG